MSILDAHVNKFVCQLTHCPRNCKHFVLLTSVYCRNRPPPLPSSQQIHSLAGSFCSPAIGANPWQCSRIRAPEHQLGADRVVLPVCCLSSSSAVSRLPSSVQRRQWSHHKRGAKCFPDTEASLRHCEGPFPLLGDLCSSRISERLIYACWGIWGRWKEQIWSRAQRRDFSPLAGGLVLCFSEVDYPSETLGFLGITMVKQKV